jgi:hypothetical protein
MDMLSQLLTDGEVAIEEAIETIGIPATLLHRFACDCIDRALQRQTNVGKEPDPKSWNALKAKQEWLQGKLNDEELEEAQEEVMTTDTTTAWGVVRLSATNAARNCVRALTETATSSVNWDHRLKAKETEEEWLIRRFSWMLGLWEEHGEETIEKLASEGGIDEPDNVAIDFELA